MCPPVEAVYGNMPAAATKQQEEDYCITYRFFKNQKEHPFRSSQADQLHQLKPASTAQFRYVGGCVLENRTYLATTTGNIDYKYIHLERQSVKRRFFSCYLKQ